MFIEYLLRICSLMREELCFPLRQEKLRLKEVGKAVGLILIFLTSLGRSIP